MRCKRCGSSDVTLFKGTHRCRVCDSTNIIGVKLTDKETNRKPSVKLYVQLWNPNSVTNLSLITHPFLSSLLISFNWVDLKEEINGRHARYWVYVWILLSVVMFFFSKILGPVLPLIYIPTLLIWYYKCAKPQVDYLDNHQYEKKSLLLPFFGGVIFTIFIFWDGIKYVYNLF